MIGGILNYFWCFDIWPGSGWTAKGEFSDSIFPPEALGELEAEEFLNPPVGDIAPGQKQQQLRGRRPGKAFPASSQIGGFDGTNTATAFCGLENCRCHSTWMLFLTTKLHCHPPFKIAKCLTQQLAYYHLRHHSHSKLMVHLLKKILHRDLESFLKKKWRYEC